MAPLHYTAGILALGLTLGLSANAEAKRGTDKFLSSHEIKETYLDCLDLTETVEGEYRCMDERRALVDRHRARVGQTRSLFRLRYYKAKMAYRDCRDRGDRAGARRQKIWLRDAKRWWRKFSRFTKYGVTSPGFTPPRPPPSCRPGGRPVVDDDELETAEPRGPAHDGDELFDEAPAVPPTSPPVQVGPGDAPKTPAKPLAEELPTRPSEKAKSKDKEKLPEFSDRELLDLGDPVEKIATLARQVPSEAVANTIARTTFVAKVADISLELQEAMVEPYPALQREMLQSVQAKLDGSLRRAINGCRADGEADDDDWVTDCRWQQRLEEQVTVALGWVRGLAAKGEAEAQ